MRYSAMVIARDELQRAYPGSRLTYTYDGPNGYVVMLSTPDQTYTAHTLAEARRLIRSTRKTRTQHE